MSSGTNLPLLSTKGPLCLPSPVDTNSPDQHADAPVLSPEQRVPPPGGVSRQQVPLCVIRAQNLVGT